MIPKVQYNIPDNLNRASAHSLNTLLNVIYSQTVSVDFQSWILIQIFSLEWIQIPAEYQAS